MKNSARKIAIAAIFSFITFAGRAQQFPEMVTVVGDSFKMGNEAGLETGEAAMVHKVTVSTFKIAKTEVTVLQWKQYCEATANPMPKETPSGGWVDNNPIVGVNWDDAVGYCEWLSAEKHKSFRLPTEAEWEYAARGGSAGKGYKYSGGKGIDYVGWTSDNSGGNAHAVASKRPNELGLYDMTGNVYEWCGDRFGNYNNNKAAVNPKGPNSGSLRVYRGGSWYTPSAYCSVINRESNNPKEGYNFVGFRPVEDCDATAQQPVYAAEPKTR